MDGIIITCHVMTPIFHLFPSLFRHDSLFNLLGIPYKVIDSIQNLGPQNGDGISVFMASKLYWGTRSCSLCFQYIYVSCHVLTL